MTTQIIWAGILNSILFWAVKLGAQVLWPTNWPTKLHKTTQVVQEMCVNSILCTSVTEIDFLNCYYVEPKLRASMWWANILVYYVIY